VIDDPSVTGRNGAKPQGPLDDGAEALGWQSIDQCLGPGIQTEPSSTVALTPLPEHHGTQTAADRIHQQNAAAYYHTDVGDLFVGGLASIGLLLILYLAGQWRRWDCLLSTVAGVALLGVVFFPTTRPGKVIPAKDVVPQIACGQQPTPTDCAPVQTWLGEAATAGIHFFCALVFIASLAALSFIFARRMATYEPANPFRHVQTACGWLIIAALAWAAIGQFANTEIFRLTPLYVAEVISVWAFATSWLLKGLSLTSLVGTKTPALTQ